MDNETFMKIVDNRLKRCREVLDAKNTDYLRGGDKLHNFHRAGEILGCYPERALLGMASKHIVSVFDMVDDIEKYQGQRVSYAHLEEKLGDAINYLLLLEALFWWRFGWTVGGLNGPIDEVKE